MRNPVSITVNGKHRPVLDLAMPEPIPELKMITLKSAGILKTGLFAIAGDYRNGTYRMRQSDLVPTPGTYRPRAIEILYTDGTTAVSELSGDVVIEVMETRRPEPGPSFTAL